MMIRDRSFPHPVLASFRDDVEPNTFALTVSVTNDADNFYLQYRFDYSNPTLTALIQEGRAGHRIHVECRRNFFREIVPVSGVEGTIVIRTSELVGRVEVCGFINALAPIGGYVIAGAHADYGSTTFEVRPGDVLAVSETQTFDAYIDYDPLRQISSILTIRKSEDLPEGAMKLATDEDRLIATLAQKDYDRYTDLKADPAVAPLIANQVVVPALLEAIHEIRAVEEDDLDIEMQKRWFRSIRKKLQDQGIDVRSSDVPPLEIVQTLLGFPLRRSLEGLLQISPME